MYSYSANILFTRLVYRFPRSNNRYLDAYAEGEEGSGAMTRENDQGGDGTQKWIFSPEDDKGHFTIRQVAESGRFRPSAAAS